jgi:hypothetical protein
MSNLLEWRILCVLRFDELAWHGRLVGAFYGVTRALMEKQPSVCSATMVDVALYRAMSYVPLGRLK